MLDRDLVLVSLAVELARAAAGYGFVCYGFPRSPAGHLPLLTLRAAQTGGEKSRNGTILLALHRADDSGHSAAASWAQNAVPEVWLLPDGLEWIERLTAPAGGLYRRRGLVLPGERIAPVGLPRVSLAPPLFGTVRK